MPTVQEYINQLNDAKQQLQDRYSTQVALLQNARAEYQTAQNNISDGLPRRSIEYVEVKDQKAGYVVAALVLLIGYLIWKGKI